MDNWKITELYRKKDYRKSQEKQKSERMVIIFSLYYFKYKKE